MERRSVPAPHPSWLYLRARQLSAGDHLPSTFRPRFTPLPRLRPPRLPIRKYSLTDRRPAAPWADTMLDSGLTALLGDDDLVDALK